MYFFARQHNPEFMTSNNHAAQFYLLTYSNYTVFVYKRGNAGGKINKLIMGLTNFVRSSMKQGVKFRDL